MNQIKLGKFIANVRIERGMTQDELAEKIGVSSGKVISKWECGNSMPDFETLIEISKALKITLYELSICKRIENPKLIDKAKNKFRTYAQLQRENIKNKILIILSIILGIIFGFATIFMIDNYKTIKIYKFNYNPEETKFRVEGNIFVNKDYAIFNVIKINNIEKNTEYLNTEITNVQYEILDDENRRVLLHNYKKNDHFNLLESINQVSFYTKIDHKKIPQNDNLKMKISYFGENNKTNEMIIKFKIEKIFENTL